MVCPGFYGPWGFCSVKAATTTVFSEPKIPPHQTRGALIQLWNASVEDPWWEQGGLILQDAAGNYTFQAYPNVYQPVQNRDTNYEGDWGAVIIQADGAHLWNDANNDQVPQPNEVGDEVVYAAVHTHPSRVDLQNGPSRDDIDDAEKIQEIGMYVIDDNTDVGPSFPAPDGGGSGVYFYDPVRDEPYDPQHPGDPLPLPAIPILGADFIP